MSAPNTMTVMQLARPAGLPDVPATLDVRTHENFAADPRVGPGGHPRRIAAAVVP